MKAFPTPTFSINNEARVTAVGGEGGMDLRDYFAAKAMQSLMINFLGNDLDLNDPNGWMDGLAMDAYSMADAMLKERNDDSSIK
jgi:hypothetical protein